MDKSHIGVFFYKGGVREGGGGQNDPLLWAMVGNLLNLCELSILTSGCAGCWGSTEKSLSSLFPMRTPAGGNILCCYVERAFNLVSVSLRSFQAFFFCCYCALPLCRASVQSCLLKSPYVRSKSSSSAAAARCH